MRIAYLDCFAGISGDMFLGALVDAGVDPQVLHDAAAAMNLDVLLKIDRVDRSGISSTKVSVISNGLPAEAAQPHHPASKVQEQRSPVQQQRSPEPLSHQPETQHLHKGGHSHSHDEQLHATGDFAQALEQHQNHGRSLTVIRQLIRESKLAAAVKETAIHAFELLGTSEAKIHNVPIDDIHFHEVGAVDAIVDIVAAAAGIHALDADQWVSSPLNVGGGMVDCAHGRFPVPAPASADLLRGLPTYSANIQMELVTPTGAALIRVLSEEKGLTFGPQPAMVVERIGYGAGTRDPKDFPNVLRLSVGGSAQILMPHASHSQRNIWQPSDPDSLSKDQHHPSETVTVLETALDDFSPQLLAYVAEAALQQGALDVMLTPVIMKKGRPGTLLTVLCNPSERTRLEELLLRETSTLGLRIREDRRICLNRISNIVETAYGPIKIKLGIRDRETLNANPEFEDCRAAAAAHRVPLKQVHQAAISAYVASIQNESSNG